MKEVHMQIDVHCKWNKIPPMYRLFVNDEMFTERTYVFQAGEYVRENLIIEAPSGNYEVKIETPSKESFKLRNLSCSYGDAQIIDNTRFRI